MEFELQDYGTARTTADQMKATAEKILDIFKRIDESMNSLYGTAWQSSGADQANSRYMELKANYENFYNEIITMHSHVHKVTTANEEADRTASDGVANV